MKVSTFKALFAKMLCEYPLAADYLKKQLEPSQQKWARCYMAFWFTLETNATSRVEGLNYAIGNVKNLCLLRLFIELEKRLRLQKCNRELDYHLQSKRLASTIRSDSCHIYGDLRNAVCKYLTPYAQTKVSKQMEFAVSYNCTLVGKLEEAIDAICEREDVTLSPGDIREAVSVEYEVEEDKSSSFGKSMSSVVPGGVCSYENLIDDYGDVSSLDMTERGKAELKESVDDETRLVLVEYKFSESTRPSALHLVLLYDDGSYCCTCGYSARNGLLCRH